MNDKGGVRGIFLAHLCKHAAQCQFTAKCVTTMSKIHLTDFIRICLQQDRDVYVRDGGLDAVFIAEVGQANDQTVIFAMVCFQKLSIRHTLLSGFNSIVLGNTIINAQSLYTDLFESGQHLTVRGLNNRAREEATVCY